MKIITLNLFYPGPNELFLQAVKWLVSQQADIMLLQEVCSSPSKTLPEKFRKLEVLKTSFPAYFADFMPCVTDTREIEGEVTDGNLVLSRYPLSELKHVFVDKGHGFYDHDATTDFSEWPAGFIVGNLELENKRIKLINLHGPVNLNGSEADERRLKMKEKLLQELEDESRVILGGDSNARINNPIIKELESKLINPFAGELITTFNISRKNLVKNPGYAESIVDVLFVSPEIKVLSHTQPQVDVSDHLPLVIEIVA